MKKRIGIADLKEGMFVDKVEAKWLETPFYHNPVKQADINRLKQFGILYIWIDTEKCETHNEETPEQIQADGQLRSFDAFRQELSAAREIKTEAVSVASEILSDIRMGKQLKSEKLKNVVSNMMDSVERNPDALLSLSRLKDFDNYTFMHSVNVSILSMTLARALDFKKQEIFEIGLGGMLHDIGKMQVPEEVLNHPGKLSGEAWSIMKRHVEYSTEIIQQMTEISEDALTLASQHHERLNGSGYPYGLKFFDISEAARIGAIADVYDAVTSKRVYKDPVFPAESLKILIHGKGTHFQPYYVDTFVREIGLYPIGSIVELENGEIAEVVFNNTNAPLMPIVRILLTSTHKKLPHPKEIDLSKSTKKNLIIRIVDPAKFDLDSEVNK